MARHRNVRTMNIDDEYYDDDTVYGHSVPDDDYCISPGTAAQFTFNRERRTDLSSFMGREEIPEEEPEDFDLEEPPGGSRSEVKQPRLSDKDQDHLNRCLEEIRGILADTYPDQMIRDTIIAQDYNTSKALDVLLSQQDAPKPQREPRPNRRNRSQGDDDYDSSDSSSSEFSQTVSKDGISNRPGSRESSAPVKLSKNGQVFRFESPLSMLRKAVESRSPPQHTDIPKLVSNRIGAERNTTVVQQGKVAASSNDTASRPVVSLSELIKKRAEGGDAVRTEGIRPGLGMMSLTDLVQQNDTNRVSKGALSKQTIQSEDVPSKIAKLSLMDDTGSKLSSKMLSLADLSLKHSSKANVKNSSKGPSLAELHSKHASKVSSPFNLGSKQTSAMSNTLGKPSLTLEELNSKHSSKSPTLSEISSKHSPSKPSSLADLSSKHSPSLPSSLADLSSKHSSKRPTLSGMSPGPSPKRPTLTGSAEDSAKQPTLADLNSKHSVKHPFHNPEKTKIREPKSTTNLSGGHTSLSNQKHSTSEPIKIDLTKALLRLNCKDELENQSSGTDKEVSDNLPTRDMQITEEASAEISPMPMLLEVAPVFVSRELQASFSAFGSVLATACIHGDLEKKNNNFPSFSYHRQARPGRKLPSPPADVEACIPFDFSSPSPDDRVKAKQKEAFTGNSRKPLT